MTTLETTDSDLHELRAAVNAKRRKETKTCNVDADSLRRLLNDHHTLWTISQRKANWKPGDDQESMT